MLFLMVEDVLEVWRVHEEINSFLLARIPGDGFNAVMPPQRGQPSHTRTVAQVFAHLHGMRLEHLGRDLLEGVPRLDSNATPSREQLQMAFKASGAAVETRLSRVLATHERIEERPGIVLLGYLVSHESHHRGQILLALKHSGVGMPAEAQSGMWTHWFRPYCGTSKERSRASTFTRTVTSDSGPM